MMINKIFSRFFGFLILLYQGMISPLLGGAKCRYTPSCSEYSKQAIQKYGPWKGLRLSIRRISSCHPRGGSGYDPVP